MNSHCPSEPGPVDTDIQLIECFLSFGIDQNSMRSLPIFDPLPTWHSQQSFISARYNIYISCLCHDASPSVRLSVTEEHWRIIANLGFKFRSHFTAH